MNKIIKHKILPLIAFAILASFFSSCSTLNKSRMLKTPRNFKFAEVVDSLRQQEYRINVDDEVSLQMYSNDGYSFIFLGMGSAGVTNTKGSDGDQGGGGGRMMRGGGGNSYKVRPDSCIKIPIIGLVKVAGLTLTELEIVVENKLKNHFKDPFVIARIENKRIFVLKSGNNSVVYQLQNQNTTLFEVLAATGGVPDDGNASKIKIIRGNPENPEIFMVDLSKVDGIKDANIIMQANDIVYVNPFLNYAALIGQDISTIANFASSIVLLFTIDRIFKQEN